MERARPQIYLPCPRRRVGGAHARQRAHFRASAPGAIEPRGHEIVFYLFGGAAIGSAPVYTGRARRPAVAAARTVAIAAVAAAVPLAVWQTQAAPEPAAEAGAGSAGGLGKAGEAALPGPDAGTGPCGEGFYTSGDVCEPAPPGYVETRSECEMAVDSMEAAGVEQDYMAETAKCRGG